MSAHRVDVAVFSLALAVFGLVALALVWSGDWAYALLARATGNTEAIIVVEVFPDGSFGRMRVELKQLLEWHHGWAAYVTGVGGDPPRAVGPARLGNKPLFTPDEYAHMADVRNVFAGAQLVGLLALAVVAFRLRRAWRERRALRLARDGGFWAAGVVALAGVGSAFAFDPLFLLFHETFFPQGNFLFDPATSNLLRLYPEWYWQGITAGVGLSFIAVAILVAGAAHIALRRGSNTYTRAA